MKIALLILGLVLIGVVLYFNRNNEGTEQSQDNRIEITNESDWDELEKVILNFNNDLRSGKQNIIGFIDENYPEFDSNFLAKIKLNAIKEEFNNYLADVISTNPISKDIESLNFGIFESKNKNYLCYVSGSTSSHQNDTDWAVDPIYFPKQYLEIDEFNIIFSELKKYKGNISDIEQLLINGFMNLVIANSTSEIDDITDKKLNLGSGFDSGDIFIVREK